MPCDRAEAKTGLKRSASSFNQWTLLRIAGVTAIALTAANCSSNVRGGIDPKYGVAPSPKVVADGQPVPKGGGREMVGKPYTVAGRTYVPNETPRASEGLASWYGANFHGRMTANGEVFDRDSIAAAHTTMPLPSYARVTNMQNGHSTYPSAPPPLWASGSPAPRGCGSSMSAAPPRTAATTAFFWQASGRTGSLPP
jgi:rare lipoprotein A